MDNVPSLAIQAPIVREVPSMLCPTAVYSMDADVVMKIAGESDDKTLHREELLRQLDILNAGARICKQHAIRPKSGTYCPIVFPTELRPDFWYSYQGSTGFCSFTCEAAIFVKSTEQCDSVNPFKDCEYQH